MTFSNNDFSVLPTLEPLEDLSLYKNDYEKEAIVN